jgi:hypothetical protein
MPFLFTHANPPLFSSRELPLDVPCL